MKERSEKADLKLNTEKALEHGIWSHHFKENTWEKAEAVTDFIFLGSKMTVDGECSHEIKICLLLGRKAITNLDSILKSRDITLSKTVSIVSYGFPTSHELMLDIEKNNRMGKTRDLFKKIRYQGNISCKDGLNK